jgi:signal transduction histidine kinase
LERKEFSKSVNILANNFNTELNKIENFKSKSNREDRLFKIYLSAENALLDIENSLEVVKPSFLGLSSRLRGEWELYLSEVERIKSEIIAPVRGKINSELERLRTENKIGLNPTHLKFAGLNSIDEQFKAYAKLLDSVGSSMKKVSSESSIHFKKRFDDYCNERKKEWEEIVSSQTVDGVAPAQLYGELLSKIKIDLEPLTNFLKELKAVYDDLADSISKDKFPAIFETTAILEEENIRLREQYDEAIELSQLGMTVSVISHEFEMNVRNIRSLLSRLKVWADINTDLKKLYEDIKRNFEHLDGYLSLFTPLQKRLHRAATEIYGGEIAEYLREVFAERLESENITIESTDEFSKSLIIGYPSTFYPVFVNLVDNAIYWLKNHRSPRIITLALDVNGSMIVADNGPGINKRDKDLIFDAGFTRKPGGRGLGLKISRDVLRKANYDLILAESEQGAVFRIEPKN